MKDPPAALGAAAFWILPLAGCLLRLADYFSRRSLWFDEALLATNVVELGPFELLFPLPNGQVAPPLFLILADAGTLVFGIDELSLRLIPLLASMASVLLFAALARRLFGDAWAQVAVFPFAFSPWLVYYAQELKPYATDVFVALALLYLFLRLLEARSRRSLVVLALAGLAAPWISFPAVFVLAAIGTALFAEGLRGTSPVSVRWLVATVAGWLCSFALEYGMLFSDVFSRRGLQRFWAAGFLPLPIDASGIGTWEDRWLSFLSFAGFVEPWCYVALTLLLLGAAAFAWERSARGRMLLLVFAFTLAASMLHAYPFWRRTALFLVPFTLLVAVRGLQSLRGRRTLPVCVALGAAFLFPFAAEAIRWGGPPPIREEVRPLLETLEQRRRAGDRVYVYHGAAPAVRYYARVLDLDTRDWHFGERTHNPSRRAADAAMMTRWPRVWFLFSHVRRNEDQLFAAVTPGRIVELHEEANARLVLYRFGPDERDRALAARPKKP